MARLRAVGRGVPLVVRLRLRGPRAVSQGPSGPVTPPPPHTGIFHRVGPHAEKPSPEGEKSLNVLLTSHPLPDTLTFFVVMHRKPPPIYRLFSGNVQNANIIPECSLPLWRPSMKMQMACNSRPKLIFPHFSPAVVGKTGSR